MAGMRVRQRRRGAGLALAASLVLVLASSPGDAATAKPATTGAGSAAATPNATIRLIEILIQNGVLTRAQAQALLKQAEEEAAAAARQAQPQPGAAGTAATPAPAVIQAPDAPPGTVRVPYVPETVKKQIKEELRQEVVQQAKSEGWAEPDSVPEWVSRIRLSGDLRGRFEQDLLDKDNITGLADFNEINDGNPLQVNSAADVFDPIPTLNTTDDRTRYRLRARVGLDAQIDDWVSAGLRLATGNDESPVSTNQTLGGGDGEFSKYNIWLDRAFVQLAPADWVTGTIGRMPNPFWTSDLLFDTDLNFDGAAAQLTHRFDDRTSVFFNAGGFPVFNTDFDFPQTSTDKVRSRDKYLLAGQAGVDHRVDKEHKVRVAVGFFNFENINGKTSRPCDAFDADVECDTDQSRPLFVQKGNSMFGIRDFASPTATTPQFQYFGLAPQYGVLDLRGRLDISTYDPLHISLEANFLKNLLFDHKEINGKTPVTNLSGDGKWEGGDTGFMLQATVGDERIDELWDWNVSLAYKYLESDAVPDAFTDSDFHLGGTNAKGYILGGNLGVAKNTFLSLRWLSADEVSGPPLAIDVLQLDLNTSF